MTFYPVLAGLHLVLCTLMLILFADAVTVETVALAVKYRYATYFALLAIATGGMAAYCIAHIMRGL